MGGNSLFRPVLNYENILIKVYEYQKCAYICQTITNTNDMTTEVKNLKSGDIFTDSGITVRVESIERDDLVNGTENYRIVATSIDYNKKMFTRMQLGLPCFYSKKGDTKIRIK